MMHEWYLHWMAYVNAAQEAKAAGERVEAQVFPSKTACEAAVSTWKAEWYKKIDEAGAHNLVQGMFWGALCQ
jgi:hypothetical protein